MMFMGSRLTVVSKTRAEAQAWADVLRGLGLNVGGPTDMRHDGSWLVQASAGRYEDEPSPATPSRGPSY